MVKIKNDPKLQDPKYKKIIDEVFAEVEAKHTKEEIQQNGFCYQLWLEVKHILWNRYKIDWKTPDELNPDIMYD